MSQDTDVLLNSCYIRYNISTNAGGGILAQLGANVNVNGCIVSKNIADLAGGGVIIFPFSSSLVVNSTISDNTVKDEGTSEEFGGGGVYVGKMIVASSVISGNTAVQGADIFTSGESEVRAINCDIGDIYGSLTTSNNVISADPEFANPAAGDFHLLYGSPCIDAGSTNAGGGMVDMDGEARPFGAAMDMGADEFTDTDADNMADYWEVEQYGDIVTTEGTEDTDGDALNTFGEYMHQTDPHNGDTDNDDMPDGWEVANDLDALADDAALDPDGDNMQNISEYMADTDPQNTLSLLQIQKIFPERGGMHIEWCCGVNAGQWLESCGSLVDRDWKVIFALPPPTPKTNAVIVFDSRANRFYRIRAERE